MKFVVICCRAVTLALAISGASASGEVAKGDEALVLLAQPGPWSAVSNLIGYQERLWFVNSVKYVNHNSADVYSYDPERGTTRFERHLFSQDAGSPVVLDGRLYWPFEDGRFSTGTGEFMVTDGHSWQWRMLAPAQVFHVHAMTGDGGDLYAATSAWRGGLQRSTDGGRSWQVLYDHPTPPRRVSRFTSLANLDGQIFAGLTSYAQPGGKLFALRGQVLTQKSVWPSAQLATGLVAYKGWLYGLQVDANGQSVWRTGGHKGERIPGLSGVRVRALASDFEHIWAVSVDDSGGVLWRSTDGQQWQRLQRFDGAEPVAVAVYAQRVYVGTIGPGNRGGLWGPPAPVPIEAFVPAQPLPSAVKTSLTLGLQDAAEELDAALLGADDYRSYRQRLFAALTPLAESGSMEAARLLSERLESGRWSGLQPMFGGGFKVPLQQVNQWYLLWALSRLGQGSVPEKMLREVWDREENSAQKYFHPTSAAAWAVVQLGQDDPGTLSTLIARLQQPGDPKWLRGDIVGALAALTGQWHGYDSRAWERWWLGSGPAPP